MTVRQVVRFREAGDLDGISVVISVYPKNSIQARNIRANMENARTLSVLVKRKFHLIHNHSVEVPGALDQDKTHRYVLDFLSLRNIP